MVFKLYLTLRYRKYDPVEKRKGANKDDGCHFFKVARQLIREGTCFRMAALVLNHYGDLLVDINGFH